MALPTIVFNTSTGSDTAASGAGPSTAVTGTGASLNGTTTVDVSADSPDLSGIATDGSAVLWVSTSSGKQFGKITGTDNTAKTITVASAYSVTESSRTWAVGGKRATFDATSSRRLIEADIAAGWTIQTETDQSLTADLTPGTSGTASSPITVKGDSASTLRVITQTANDECFDPSSATYWWFENLKLQNSNGTKTAAYGILASNSTGLTIKNCVLGDSTNTLLTGVRRAAGTMVMRVVGSRVQNCTSHGMSNASGAGEYVVIDSVIANNSGVGIQFGAEFLIQNSLVFGNGSDGLAAVSASATTRIIGNTIHGNTGDGIDSTGATSVLMCFNNNITGNGGYGFNASSSHAPLLLDFNNYGTGATANTSGSITGLSAGANSLSVDPGYTSAAGENFSVGTNVKAAGFPSSSGSVGGTTKSSTTSYVDIGAAQREEPAGGGGGIRLAGPGGLVGMGV